MKGGNQRQKLGVLPATLPATPATLPATPATLAAATPATLAAEARSATPLSQHAKPTPLSTCPHAFAEFLN